MQKFGSSLLLSFLVLAASSLVAEEHPRISPHETVNASVAANELTVTYGRPRTKDPKSGEERKIWGGLVPYGQVWRMGADEATLFTTKKDIQMGDSTIPAGTYSLYLLPNESGDAKLIVNKQTGQWGTKYDQSQDLARIDLKQAKLEDPVDQFTIEITETNAAGVLKLSWEETEYSVAFSSKA